MFDWEKKQVGTSADGNSQPPKFATAVAEPADALASTADISANLSDSSDIEYCFTPVKGDTTDEVTQSLFDQLEEGANCYTDIYATIREGANLYAKSTDEHEGCYPIHIAAYEIGSNSKAVLNILQTFDDSEKRKNYVFLRNDQGKNVLDILIEGTRNGDDGLSAPALISVLSYLTPAEQIEALNGLSEKAKNIFEADEYSIHVEREEDILDISQIYQLYKSGSHIEMCQQRKKEEASLQSGYDSGDESLGNLGEVQNRKFTARVFYKIVTHTDGTVKSIPELSLIPSDWRLPTATQDNTQGDHVIAYVLLLSSLSHCRGEKIKTLPTVIFEMACRVLPDHQAYFFQKKVDIEAILERNSVMRKQAIASLQQECDKPAEFLNHIEDSLKRTEIEYIARHVEEVVDHFIETVNALEGESFSQTRKERIKVNFLLGKIASLVYEAQALQDSRFNGFKIILIGEINAEAQEPRNDKSGGITDPLLKSIADQVIKKIPSDIQVPDILKGQSNKLTKGQLVTFLKNQTPLKKHHEGQAVRDIRESLQILARTIDPRDRAETLSVIGKYCAKLFDYPCVGNAELDDVDVLCKAIPRHLIIFCCAFKELSLLSGEEKQRMYDVFLNHLLVLQFWNDRVTLPLLKANILKFADIDADSNYTMKRKPQLVYLPKKGNPTMFGNLPTTYTAVAGSADNPPPADNPSPI